MRTDPLRRALAAACCLALAACAVPPAPPPSEPLPPVADEALLPLRCPPAARAEASARSRRATGDPCPALQQAIQLGQARPPELARASNLLESVMKSTHPDAARLASLARLLHEQYNERLRLEQQLREAQRRGDELQEKIDALTAIERSLPARPQPKASGGGSQ